MNLNKPHLKALRVDPEFYCGASWEVVDVTSGRQAWGVSWPQAMQNWFWNWMGR